MIQFLESIWKLLNEGIFHIFNKEGASQLLRKAVMEDDGDFEYFGYWLPSGQNFEKFFILREEKTYILRLGSGVSGNSRLPYKFVGISHEFIRQKGIPDHPWLG